MKKSLIFFFACFVSITSFSQKIWKKQAVKIPAPICYGSNEVHRTFVKPPEGFPNKLKSAGGKSANIVVVYDDAFKADTQAKNAFEAAVSIWESLIYSPVPIYIYAYWSDLNQDVLGSCGPWDFYENLDFMPQKNTFYPIALVEKMLGEEISDGATPDMRARFNRSNKNWYFGTDGNTPSDKYDFLTVVLHEIGHGLGYTGMAHADTLKKTAAFLGYAGNNFDAGIFDRHIVNSENNYLTNTSLFQNPSSDLFNQFQSGYLLFKGQIPFEDGGSNTYPRLYAPIEWDEGSSIYHLNERTYLPGNLNSLMTPAASKGEAIHHPGDLSLGILFEMGWKFIQIKHDEHPDIEKVADIKPIEAFIESDYELDSTRLYLISSKDNFVHADTVLLKSSDRANVFVGQVKMENPGILKYYFSAQNKRKQTFRMPGVAPEKSYSITYGQDITAPVLTHQPISFMREANLSEELVVGAKDNLGIQSVKIEYLVNDQEMKTLELKAETKDLYKTQLSFTAGSLFDGDSIRYRIIAVDKSVQQNQSVLPATGYYSFRIEGTYKPVTHYFNDFNKTNRDFFSADYSIQTPKFFVDGALHSLHPYKSPEKEDMFFEYIAQLKYPIILKNGGMMSYKEVVLVEPAEDGAVFGSDEFWDYVIVEGSKDSGKTWKYLIDGYDSGANKSWKSAYNTGIIGNNSEATGTKDLLIKRDFLLNQKGHFAVGDTILIRFRLHSDPFANGWGWCIDDLNIQDPVTNLAELEYSPGELMFYPSPVEDVLVIQGHFSHETHRIKLIVYNSLGNAVREQNLDVFGNAVHERIDMNHLRSGLYIVSIEFENGERISRKIIKK